MKKRQIVNIVNFIRACEPRMEMDLVTPVLEQIRVMKEYNLQGTFLLQYDALLNPEFTEPLKALEPSQFELGVWHEIVQPEVEACGIQWTGRYPWDWHAHCGFSVGYTKPQREALCDALFEKFKEVFGYYPRVFGSWLFDSHTLRYLSDTYGLDAICNCKEQYGTDGYTLWGGYYGQAYYPSRTNCFMPAQTAAEQLPVPLFRMLGSDPVYQYDSGINIENGLQKAQGVITLEPVYVGKNGGGGVPEWVDWYLRENFNGDCLTFGYAQAGQENSFGWDSIGPGFLYQAKQFARLRESGSITVEPLGETGRRYKATYETTPASAIVAHTAFDDDARNSVWYSSKYYRINLYGDHGTLRIRDCHLFAEAYPDPFENTVCVTNEVTYETLPITDGNRFSGNGILAGITVEPVDGAPFIHREMTFRDEGANTAVITYGEITVTLRENSLRIEAPREFHLIHSIGRENDHFPTLVSLEKNKLLLSYNGTKYGICPRTGYFADSKTVCSENGTIEIAFSIQSDEA